ncbi:MAG: hypothetical protein WKF84_02470 [Pyrinomonadaceae bacterium]
MDDTNFQRQTSLEKPSPPPPGERVVLVSFSNANTALTSSISCAPKRLMRERQRELRRKRACKAVTGSIAITAWALRSLHELGLRRIMLLTKRPPKVAALEGFELEIVGHVPLGSARTGDNSEQ